MPQLFHSPLCSCFVFCFTYYHCPAFQRHSLSTLSWAALTGIAKCLWILMKQQLAHQCLRSTSQGGSVPFSFETKHVRICCVACTRQRLVSTAHHGGDELFVNISFCFIECQLALLCQLKPTSKYLLAGLPGPAQDVLSCSVSIEDISKKCLQSQIIR